MQQRLNAGATGSVERAGMDPSHRINSNIANNYNYISIQLMTHATAYYTTSLNERFTQYFPRIV